MPTALLPLNKKTDFSLHSRGCQFKLPTQPRRQKGHHKPSGTETNHKKNPALSRPSIFNLIIPNQSLMKPETRDPPGCTPFTPARFKNSPNRSSVALHITDQNPIPRPPTPNQNKKVVGIQQHTTHNPQPPLKRVEKLATNTTP